jgi:hypothetical protein
MMGQQVEFTRGIRDLSRVVRQSERAADYVELTRIHFLAKLNQTSHWEIARTRNPSTRVLDLIEKGAVTVGATTDPGSVGILQNLAEAYLQSPGLFSSFDTILSAGGFLTVPLLTRVFSVTLTGTGHEVDENRLKPVTKLSLQQNQIVRWKSIGVVGVTQELLRSISSAAADFINNELSRAVGYITDQTFCSHLTGNTGTPSVVSAGPAAANFLTDLAAALALIGYGRTSKLFLIVPPVLGRRLLTLRDSGGWIMTDGRVGDGIQVVRTDALSNEAILLDSSQIAAASDGVVFNNTSEGAVITDDNPTAGAPTKLTSAFMENMVFMKAERFFGCEVIRDNALCLITGIT